MNNQKRAKLILDRINSENNTSISLTQEEIFLLKEIVNTPDVTQVIERPESLPCKLYIIKDNTDLHPNEKGKLIPKEWVVFVGLKDGKVFEIFVGEIGDDVLYIHKKMVEGEIIKTLNDNKESVYTLRVKDKHGFYKSFEGINRVFDNEYYNELISISFMLRYFPNEKVIHVIKKWKGLSPKMEKFREIVIMVLEKYV